ncbi:hypothetical protein [uncultured Friedmanniella sp.]|uniref:hypothetical protein n=1 Tax=uncultured Friedmanniella sp. TaxID=335381 RepID=UPI0035CBD7E0
MTQSPYLPSDGGQEPQTGEWASTGSPAPTQADFDPAAPYGQFDEPVTDPLVVSTATEELYVPVETDTTSGSSAKETAQATAGAAKDEASDLKDTAVDRGQQVAGVAKEQASAVKDTAVDKGQQVVDVAKEQAAAVTSEATNHAKDLLEQGRGEVASQLVTQQQRLGSLVHSFAEELGSMGSSADNPGPLSGLAKQGSRTVGELAHRLENSEPADLLEDLRNFARRRPVAFLTGAAVAGIVVGRLSRSLASEAHDKKVAAETPALPASTGTYATTTSGYDSGSYTTGGYETGTYATGAPTYATDAPVAGYTETVGYDDTVSYAEPGRGDITR